MTSHPREHEGSTDHQFKRSDEKSIPKGTLRQEGKLTWEPVIQACLSPTRTAKRFSSPICGAISPVRPNAVTSGTCWAGSGSIRARPNPAPIPHEPLVLLSRRSGGWRRLGGAIHCRSGAAGIREVHVPWRDRQRRHQSVAQRRVPEARQRDLYRREFRTVTRR
jgi:hypothetical protein